MWVWEICFSHEKTWHPIASWDEIERELDQLNIADHAYFDLSKDGCRYMRVYSGSQDRVVVEYLNVRLYPPYQYQLLSDPKQTTPVVIDAWEGWDLPSSVGVDKALAKRALMYFYETQEPLEWYWISPPPLWELRINRSSYPVRKWDQIEQAIDQMDNDTYAYVSLGYKNDDENVMEVYGGNQGRVYLRYIYWLELDPILVDRTQTEPVRLFDGFEQKDFGFLPPHYCVDKDLAKLALHFFETRRLYSPLDWMNPEDEPIQGEPRIYP